MTSRIYLSMPEADKHMVCAFCGMPEQNVKHMFIGSENKGICTTCVGYVREDMGLAKEKTNLEILIDDIT